MTNVQGSTPQKPGSLAIFGKHGLLAGTIGGGKTENLVTQKAIEAIQTNKSGYYKFELNDDINEQDSVICGGKMNIFLDASPQEHEALFLSIVEAYSNKTPGVIATIAKPDISKGFTLEKIWITNNNFSTNSSLLPSSVIGEVKKMLETQIPGDFKEISLATSKDSGNSYIFLESIKPLPELIIAGGGHIGKALSHIGKLIDFNVTVWDDRQEYANAGNLPDADNILCGDFETTLGKTKVDKDAFIVIVTRGHKQDSDVLKHFIRSNAAYIGMIGSKKKVAQVREMFLSKGWANTEEWDQIHAPIGLDIKSKTVEEIAVSIAAELIQERYLLHHSNG